MPELPEVETIRRDLNFAVLGKGIRSVKIWTDKIVKNNSQEFIKLLEGNRFDQINRTGKLLQFELAYGDQTLLVHLRMTGQLLCHMPGGIVVGDTEDLPNKHTHVSIYLVDGTILHFNDIRTFGYLQLVDDQEKSTILERFGIEPMTPNFIWEDFLKIFKNRKTPIKNILLNQQLISGIGNIYADEICYRAKIRPDRSVSTLKEVDLKRVFNACENILKQAVAKRGTSFSDYVDASGNQGGYAKFLKVYNKEGERCHRCGDDRILKTRVAGRGTHYCANCQN